MAHATRGRAMSMPAYRIAESSTPAEHCGVGLLIDNVRDKRTGCVSPAPQFVCSLLCVRVNLRIRERGPEDFRVSMKRVRVF
jgi:hypothetical protein